MAAPLVTRSSSAAPPDGTGVVDDRPFPPRPPHRWHREWPFLMALALGVLVRVMVLLGFRPMLVHSDGPLYLVYAEHLRPYETRTVGYSIILRGILDVQHSLLAIAVVQHLAGLLTAVVCYVLLRRRSVRPWVATLATLPVLLDVMQLVLEHSVLSDCWFLLLFVVALLALTWRRTPRPTHALIAGLAIGAATVVRTVGEPVLLAGVCFVLLAAVGWRAKLASAVLMCVAFGVTVVPYAAWFHDTYGAWALQREGGLSLYMRSTSFVHCDRVQLPSYERPLCPKEPVDRRLDPTDYGWHNPAVTQLKPPAGMTRDQVLHDFGVRAIRSDPGGYVRVVWRDYWAGFSHWERDDFAGYRTAVKWNFHQYLDVNAHGIWAPQSYQDFGATPRVVRPWASMADWYGHVYLPGTAVGLLTVVAVAGLFVRRRVETAPTRLLIALFVVLGLGLALVPVVAVEFVWRYDLETIVIMPMAAALAWTRWRASRAAIDDPTDQPVSEGRRSPDRREKSRSNITKRTPNITT